MKPTDVVRDLGVLLDSELTMKRHVSKTASTCFYHLRRLRQLRRRVDIDTAFIFSRLDYCNAVLYGLPQSTIGPLQQVQNAAARVTLGLSPRAALAASRSSYPVQGCAFDVYGTRQSLSCVCLHARTCIAYMYHIHVCDTCCNYVYTCVPVHNTGIAYMYAYMYA